MTDQHEMTCDCGRTRWQIDGAQPGRVVTCYCADCQAYAKHLGAAGYLDSAGGTKLRQTIPVAISFPDGTDRVGLTRLGPRGLFRWHTTCCNTPIANTLPKPGFPFVGAVLRPEDDSFGRTRAQVQTKAARRPVKERGMLGAVATLFARAAQAKLSGRSASPFFTAGGAPIAPPTVLTLEERAAATPR
ncbi:DUF6151 family protein [Mesobacterium pallidum]|uniref:DUF6151 family protein n=1 Tax=Mesobacterium pallidum TaxID=2872037 RepID=UPI001EE1FB8A|nr:DUF6151 family protein [Mesobacterium pallidum]